MSLSRPSRFPLLKLPWLCIECVLHNTDLVDIICFAIISSRTRRSVQYSKYPLKEIEVHPRWERKIYMGKTMGAATDRKIWCFKNGNYAYADKFVLQKNSQPFYNRQCIDHWGAHYLYSYTTGDTLDALKMGIDFLTDVFGCKIRQVFVNGDKLSELFGLGITSVKELFISDNGPVNVTGLNNPISLEDFEINHLNPMPFCEKRRNRCLLAKGLEKVDMSSGRDILRKDGLLATLSTFSTSILFYVWHKRFPDAVEHN